MTLNLASMLLQTESGPGGPLPVLLVIFVLGISVLFIAGVWKTLAKAGQPGWGAIVPIYNVVLLLRIAERPVWWILLYLVPLVNIVIGVLVGIDIAKRFGKGGGFGVGLAFLGVIFYPLLGFSDAEYDVTV